MKCVRSGKRQIFLPFSFIKNYFDVFGTEEAKFFRFEHSYSKVFPAFKERKYDPETEFLQFADFDVASRSRVLAVSAAKNVPISTQWDKDGYFYSTQIAQFGLSHYSKAVVAASAKAPKAQVVRLSDFRGAFTHVSSLDCAHFDSPIFVDVASDVSADFKMLNFELQYKEDVNVTLQFEDFNVKFVPKEFHLKVDGNDALYGYGSKLKEAQWKSFTRNFRLDLKKAFKKTKKAQKLLRVAFSGIGCVRNLTLTHSEHLKMFFSAADWLLDEQDETGAWPVDVVFNKDRVKYPGAEEISPGWHSAMASGHALSVFSRAYKLKPKPHYMKALLKALKPFRSLSAEGGFLAHFLDNPDLPWYEEYPTTPNSFVLNGFMYALLGLYDASKLLREEKSLNNEAWNLFEAGMTSLKKLLPLYDTGSGSVYDLRHFSMSGSPPKIARWDYHSTHVNLLYVLSTIDSDEDSDDADLLVTTGDRWRDYMLGKRAEHN